VNLEAKKNRRESIARRAAVRLLKDLQAGNYWIVPKLCGPSRLPMPAASSA
jgi:hypothetical protein